MVDTENDAFLIEYIFTILNSLGEKFFLSVVS